MKLTALALVAAMAAASSAFGQVYNEVDAGDMPGTSEAVAGSGPLTDLFGSVSVTSDADMYRIYISNSAAFSATTNNLPGTMVDTTLYLFNLNGTGIAKNDDVSGSNFLSDMPVGAPQYASLAPGEYYLAISGFAFVPYAVNPPATIADLVFDVNAFTGVQGPQQPGPILGWANAGMYDSGTYHITLTGAEFVTVPTPGAAALLGLAGIVAGRRRRA